MALDPLSCFLCGGQKIGDGHCSNINCSSNHGKFYIGVKKNGEKEIFSAPLANNPYKNIFGRFETPEEASSNMAV